MALSSWNEIKIILLHLHGLAILASLARLFYRKRTCRLWWDDFWAFAALVCDCTMVAAYVVRKAQENDMDTLNVLRWISLITFTSALWSAKLSIAVTIVRLVPPGPGRHAAKAVAAIFVLMWAGLLIQKLFICGGHSVTLIIARCQVPNLTGIVELCTDLTADLWLIFSPAYLLWGAKLTHRRQIVIFSVFASNILLSIASIAHSILIFKHHILWILISAQIEVAVSLLICNLLVLVTWIYSRIFPNEEDDDSTHHTPENLSRQASHRPTIPNYGFDGSVLVLTEISMSLLGTFEQPPSHSTFGYNRIRPHTFHDLNSPIHHYQHHYQHHPTRRSTLLLRPTQSCPAIFHLPRRISSPVKFNNCPRGGTFSRYATNGTTTTTDNTNRNSRFPSLAISSDSEPWDPMRCETESIREMRLLRQLYRERKRRALERQEGGGGEP